MNDPEFLGPLDVDQKDDWRRFDRRRHPKRYLEFLTDPSADGDWSYKETGGGADALRDLDGPTVLRHADRARFARSLAADLADALDVACPFEGETAQLTWAPGRGEVLRNV